MIDLWRKQHRLARLSRQFRHTSHLVRLKLAHCVVKLFSPTLKRSTRFRSTIGRRGQRYLALITRAHRKEIRAHG
jgi:hypothetical protein